MALRRLARNRQPQPMPRRVLPRCAEERFAQLLQVFGCRPGPMVTHADHDAVLLTHGAHFHRLTRRVEAQGIAQQVVHGAFDQRWPTLQGQPRLRLQAHVLVWCAEQGVLAYAAEQGIEVDRLGMRLLGIDPGQGKDFADQVFQAVALAGQARPQGFPLLGPGALGQGQRDAQPGQR
ncbi:hypothetical protein D3C80_1298740 [compost metagenome]